MATKAVIKMGFVEPDTLGQVVGRPLASRLLGVLKRCRASAEYSREFVKWRMLAPVATVLYRSVVNHLSRAPLVRAELQTIRPTGRAKRIVYYIWSFPTLSETFIQREVAGLIKAGVPVEVIAHEVEDRELLGHDARALMEQTRYLTHIGRRTAVRYAWGLFRRRPLGFINLFFFIVGSRYDGRKCPALDRDVFGRAVLLAAILREKEADHVHAPWASSDAFVALAAARLLKITYTVQARAYDIHRHTSKIGLPLKLANAAFVATNSSYNEAVLKSLLPAGSGGKVRRIYNGIEISRFQPRRRVPRPDACLSLLSVGDLVEPKGFEYLIRACKILKERGTMFKCRIIGGRLAAESNYYIELMKLRKALSLEEEVVFLGRQTFDRVLEAYQDADIFVLPAVTAKHGGRDITPNAVIEAMAMKLPVVSTLSGAIPEIVENGVSGILLPPRDEEALVQAIVGLIENESLREQLGNNARKRVEERFDIGKNVSDFVTLFTRGVC
jgi:colanic acid/amylovoran biosynthesis glycosyltransferase